MSNSQIKMAILESHLKQYQIAAFLGVSECTFSRWFRYEMPEKRKEEILNAIAKMKGNQT